MNIYILCFGIFIVITSIVLVVVAFKANKPAKLTATQTRNVQFEAISNDLQNGSVDSFDDDDYDRHAKISIVDAAGTRNALATARTGARETRQSSDFTPIKMNTMSLINYAGPTSVLGMPRNKRMSWDEFTGRIASLYHSPASSPSVSATAGAAGAPGNLSGATEPKNYNILFLYNMAFDKDLGNGESVPQNYSIVQAKSIHSPTAPQSATTNLIAVYNDSTIGITILPFDRVIRVKDETDKNGTTHRLICVTPALSNFPFNVQNNANVGAMALTDATGREGGRGGGGSDRFTTIAPQYQQNPNEEIEFVQPLNTGVRTKRDLSLGFGLPKITLKSPLALPIPIVPRVSINTPVGTATLTAGHEKPKEKTSDHEQPPPPPPPSVPPPSSVPPSSADHTATGYANNNNSKGDQDQDRSTTNVPSKRNSPAAHISGPVMANDETSGHGASVPGISSTAGNGGIVDNGGILANDGIVGKKQPDQTPFAAPSGGAPVSSVTRPTSTRFDGLAGSTSSFVYNNIYVVVRPILLYREIPVLLVSFSYYNNVMIGDEKLFVNYMATFFNHIHDLYRRSGRRAPDNGNDLQEIDIGWRLVLSGFIDNLENMNVLRYALENSKLRSLQKFTTIGENDGHNSGVLASGATTSTPSKYCMLLAVDSLDIVHNKWQLDVNIMSFHERLLAGDGAASNGPSGNGGHSRDYRGQLATIDIPIDMHSLRRHANNIKNRQGVQVAPDMTTYVTGSTEAFTPSASDSLKFYNLSVPAIYAVRKDMSADDLYVPQFSNDNRGVVVARRTTQALVHSSQNLGGDGDGVENGVNRRAKRYAKGTTINGPASDEIQPEDEPWPQRPPQPTSNSYAGLELQEGHDINGGYDDGEDGDDDDQSDHDGTQCGEDVECSDNYYGHNNDGHEHLVERADSAASDMMNYFCSNGKKSDGGVGGPEQKLPVYNEDVETIFDVGALDGGIEGISGGSGGSARGGIHRDDNAGRWAGAREKRETLYRWIQNVENADAKDMPPAAQSVAEELVHVNYRGPLLNGTKYQTLGATGSMNGANKTFENHNKYNAATVNNDNYDPYDYDYDDNVFLDSVTVPDKPVPIMATHQPQATNDNTGYKMLYPNLWDEYQRPMPSAPAESLISFTNSEMAERNRNRARSSGDIEKRFGLQQATQLQSSVVSADPAQQSHGYYGGGLTNDTDMTEMINDARNNSKFRSRSVSVDSVSSHVSSEGGPGFILQTKNYSVIYDKTKSNYVLPKKKPSLLTRLLN